LWFLESHQYANWKASPSSFIWLHGIPGCGKTILSSTVIENVQQHCANDPGKVVAYFYFDFNDPQKRKSELMIKSLVTQLSQKCIQMPWALDSLLSSCGNGQSQPSAEALLSILRGICGEFPATYIILDALDECIDRDELMVAIKILAEWRLERLHILVTSRKERDIEDELERVVEKSSIIPLQSSIVDQDIQRYVHHRLSTDKNLKKWHKDLEIRNEIEIALMKGAHGMHVYSPSASTCKANNSKVPMGCMPA
jgi:NACHT domain